MEGTPLLTQDSASELATHGAGTNEPRSTVEQPQQSAQLNPEIQAQPVTESVSNGSSTQPASNASFDSNAQVAPKPPVEKNDAPKPAKKASLPKESWSKIQALIHNLGRFVGEIPWLNETMSILVSLGALTAIVVILATHQDQPLPKWPSLISINSLISIFSSILKAALLLPITEGISELKWIWFSSPRPLSDMDRFDIASRGPFGSAKLFRRYYTFLAWLGAAITISALAVDPFTQQILLYYDCLEPVTGTSATIPRTNNYTATGLHMTPLDNALDGPMTVALYQGLLSPPANASSSIPFECQSGNCTFTQSNEAQYTSLAMCSSVDDFSNYIIGDGMYDNYSLKGVPMTTADGQAFSSADVTQFIYNEEVRPLFMLEALMLTNKCKPIDGKTTSRPDCSPAAWAFIATLYPCIHTYGSANVSNTVLEERILSTTALQFMNMSGSNSLRFSLVGDFPSFPGIDCTPSRGPEGNKTQATSPYYNGARYANYSGEAIDASDTQYYDPACIYDFGTGATSALRDYLGRLFGALEKPNILEIVDGIDSVAGDLWLQNLYKNGTADLNSTRTYMQGLANSITAVIRQYGRAENSLPLQGTVLVNRTCIRVQWAWLTLPMALILLTSVFLVGVVVQLRTMTRKGASKRGRMAWKSSSLPLLWCGLDYETRGRYGGFDSLTAMKERADEVKVVLRRRDEEGDAKGWKLREE